MVRIFFYRSALVVAIIITMLCACKKHSISPGLAEPVSQNTAIQSGLPQQKDSIQGYFFTMTSLTQGANSSYIIYKQTMEAFFHHPGKSFFADINHYLYNSTATGGSGNINVGEVKFNSSLLRGYSSGNEVFQYVAATESPYWPNREVSWSVEGNKSISGFSVAVNRGFPAVNDTVAMPDLKRDSTYTINFNKYFGNYDSLHIALFSTSSGHRTLNKSATGTDPVISFTPAELDFILPTSQVKVIILAFNYSHNIINDKLYVYEQGVKIDRTVLVK